MSTPRHASADAPLAARLSYAQCWEDHALLTDALQPAGRRVLSVASGGCNSLALLLAGAEEVTAVDLSAAQIAVCELKTAAAALDREDFLAVLGLGPGDPVALLRHLALSEDSRAWWQAHPELLRDGVLGAGRFERYLGMFRTRILPLIHGRRTIDALLACSLDQQPAFFAERWDSWRWRGIVRLFFSRAVMARLGRSPEQFEQVSGPVAERILRRAEHVLTEIPIATNPYVAWILTGTFPDLEAAHPYLSVDGQRRLRDLGERIRWRHAPVQQVLAEGGRYDAFNLSNLGEYLEPTQWAALYQGVLDRAAPGATIAYWNLFVPRQAPPGAPVQRDPDREAAWHAADRAFFYSAFLCETVSP